MSQSPNADYVPGDLLRRALKNHDAIAAALRTGTSSKRLFKAIDDMRALKGEASALGCYLQGDTLRTAPSDGLGA